MSGHENNSHLEIPVSTDKLRDLYQKAVFWLDRNVPVVEDAPGVAFQTRPFILEAQLDGLPLSNGLPRRVLTIPGTIIRNLLPGAAEQLKVADEIQLDHQIAHFRQEPSGQFEFSNERCTFYIAKLSDVIVSETLCSSNRY